MPKLIRINLAEGLKKGLVTSNPVAGTIPVTFDASTKKLSFNSSSNDVHVAKEGLNDIQFNLTVTNAGGGSASLCGVSFPGTQPTHGFAPDTVFTPAAGTVPGKNPVVKLFGSSAGGNLTVTDNDNAQTPTGTEEYEYCLWVRYQPPGTPPPPAEYYATDPKIYNEPPPQG